MKKLLSILLACVMLLGLVAPVFAEDGEQPATDPAPVTDPVDDPTEDPATDSAVVTDPTDDPADVTDPADDPADVTDPAEDPTEDPATDPADPVDDPIDPEDPEDPTDPVDDPEDPADPTDPEDPADPEDPNAEIDLEDIDDDRNDAGETTYALWDEDTKTLTLYYGTLPETYAVKDFESENRPFWEYKYATKKVVIDRSFAKARPTTLYSWFHGFENMVSIEGLKNLNTSCATSMNHMFGYCYALTSLDVSTFDTSNVTDMGGAFCYLQSITSLDLSALNTSKVTNMNSTLCHNYKLVSLNVSGWDTSNVTDMGGLFGTLKSLKSLDVSHFNTSKVTNMCNMFKYSESLESLDISSFDMRKVQITAGMFDGCKKLHTVFVDLNKWALNSVNNDGGMFNNCPALVGGKGTVVGGTIDKTMAHIDEVGNPGYLTDIADKPRLNMGLSNDNEVLKRFYVDQIVTKSDGVVYAKLPKNSYPRFSTTSYPKLLDPQYQNYIFAGYFKNIGSGATAERTATETTGYARFIPIEVLDVYVQFRHTSLAASDPANKTDLRFITSVPDPATLGRNGQIVGFRLVNLSNGKVISDAAFGAEYCYDEIIGDYKVQTGSGLVSLTPDKFYSGVSKKVALQTVIGMPNSYFENQKRLSVQPYIITLDGTKSHATVHPFMLMIVNGKKTAAPIANN